MAMEIHYFPETDTLYISLRPDPSADVVIVNDDILIDVDAKGRAVGIEIEHASQLSETQNA